MFYLLPSIKDNVSPHEWKKFVSELDSQMHLKQRRLNITSPALFCYIFIYLLKQRSFILLITFVYYTVNSN
jgi:hypothetical protein